MTRPRQFDPETALQSALDAFRDSGYTATSTEDLCQSTNLSRSSLYNTFTSKESLFMRAIERYSEQQTEAWEDYLTSPETGRATLKKLLEDKVAAQFACDTRQMCLFDAAAVELGMSHEAIGHLLRRGQRDYRRLIEELIRRGQRDGSIDKRVSATRLAGLVHAVTSGIDVHGRTALDERDSEQAVETLMTLL